MERGGWLPGSHAPPTTLTAVKRTDDHRSATASFVHLIQLTSPETLSSMLASTLFFLSLLIYLLQLF